jgi:putative ABC transport system ATP-binding protein
MSIHSPASTTDWEVLLATPGRVADESQPEPVFRARALTKTYHMGDVDVPALRAVDLDLHAGEFVVVLGASGSGKSTLLNILGGLDTPTSGAVRFRDHDLAAADADALTAFRREHVGFVFQFYNLIPSLTARENVQLVTDIAVSPMRPDEALSLVGLGERLDFFPAQLSGGEQQRVAIARAFSNKPTILFADDPTGNLDGNTGNRIVELLEELNRESHTTIVLVTHDLTLARRAQRLIRLADGLVVEDTERMADGGWQMGDVSQHSKTGIGT